MYKIERKNGPVYRESVWISGKRIQKNFKRITDARIWKRALETDKARDVLPTSFRKAPNIEFSDLAQQWLFQNIKPKKSIKTACEYQSIIRCHFIPFFGEKFANQVTLKDANLLIAKIKDSGRKPKTINKILNVLKQIFKFAFRNKLISEYPFEGLGQLSVEQRDFTYLSNDEITKVLNFSYGRPIYFVLVLALNTGMRLGEILGLQWDKVNLGQGYLSVARTLSRHGLQNTTKTKLIRQIGLNDSTKHILKELHKKSISPYVICKSDGLPYNPDHFNNREFHPILLKAEIRKIRFHDLRHTYASQFVMNGGNIFDLQKILGHSKIEMTSVYAHLSVDHLAKAAKTVEFNSDGFCLASEKTKLLNLNVISRG